MFSFTLYVNIVQIAIWDEKLILPTGLEWGVPPGGDKGGQGGLYLYVVTRG